MSFLRVLQGASIVAKHVAQLSAAEAEASILRGGVAVPVQWRPRPQKAEERDGSKDPHHGCLL